jgi:hypothetical protein
VDPALSTAQTVQAHLEAPFESMENLLMTISPMFRERFQQALYDKLQSVQAQQQLSTNSNTHPLSLQNPNASSTIQQQQLFSNSDPHLTTTSNSTNNNNNTNNNNDIQNLRDGSNPFDELNNWIN